VHTIIYLAAGLIAITSTILALRAPTVFTRIYQRASKVAVYVVLVGLYWLAISNAVAVNWIHAVIERKGAAPPEATLQAVQVLASEAAHEQHLYIPAFLALTIAIVYMEILARLRARKANGNAA
jgi:hypothetical protein